MANTYKDIVITPYRGNANNDPVIRLSSGNATTNADMNVRFYAVSNGTLSFEGTAGQLFSITNDLSGTIFSVNDISGIPSLEVDANGKITMAVFGGNVAIGRNDPTYKLDVVGTINASNVLINGAPISTGGGASVAISDTAPSSPTANSLWWSSDLGKLFIYYNDGSSAQWVETSTSPPIPDTSAISDTANSAQIRASAAFTQANTAANTGIAAFTQANAAFTQANTAASTGVAAFNEANTAETIAIAAFATANNAASTGKAIAMAIVFG